MGSKNRLSHLCPDHQKSAARAGFYKLALKLSEYCLDNGIIAEEAKEMIERAMVETVIVNTFNFSRVNYSRIQAKTGIQRKAVAQHAQNINSDVNDFLATKRTAIRTILETWHTDKGYLDDEGNPKPLRKSGYGNTFTDLVKKHGRDATAGAILAELIENEAVDVIGKYVHVKRRDYIPSVSSPELLEVGTDIGSDYLKTMNCNLKLMRSTDKRLLVRRAICNVPLSQLPEIKDKMHDLIHRHLTIYDDELTSNSADPESGEGCVRYGLGIFEIEA